MFLECLVEPRSQHSRFSPPLVSSLVRCRCPGREGSLRFVARVPRPLRSLHSSRLIRTSRVWWHAALELSSSRSQRDFFVADSRLESLVSPGNRITSKPEEIFVREPIPLRLNRNALQTSSVRRALTVAISERSTNGSPFATAVFPFVVRLEDFGWIGITVRAVSRSLPLLERRRPVWTRPLRWSWRQSQTFASVNLVELARPVSDRLSHGLELLGFDDSVRPSLPAQLLEIFRRHLSSATAAEGPTAVAAGKKATSKRPAVARAPEQPAPKAARQLTAGAFQELAVERLWELSGRLSQLETPGKGNSSPAGRRQRPPPQNRQQAHRARQVQASLCRACWGRQLLVSAGATACARARALLGGGAQTGGLKGQLVGQTTATPAGARISQPALRGQSRTPLD